MKVFKAVVAALALVAGTGTAMAVAQPADHGAGVYVLETESGAGLVERAGQVGLGSPAAATRWRITRDGGDREAWIVRTADRARGWVLREAKPFAPVRVQPLVVFPTQPPRYPPYETWQAHVVEHVADGVVLTITSGANGWQVVVGGDYDPHLVVVPETFAPVKFVAHKVSD
ncbi:I66 family serine proteinase inhibitor [Actinosynnema sp. NPDC020468]|uniref:I66 family serine proteinase inhibitor n=1 Tax=Actinosynnema sp. NPDC020468 TaxID=3154488 RepID=UPI0033CCDFF6